VRNPVDLVLLDGLFDLVGDLLAICTSPRPIDKSRPVKNNKQKLDVDLPKQLLWPGTLRFRGQPILLAPDPEFFQKNIDHLRHRRKTLRTCQWYVVLDFLSHSELNPQT
jgi:hypothetical protein